MRTRVSELRLSDKKTFIRLAEQRNKDTFMLERVVDSHSVIVYAIHEHSGNDMLYCICYVKLYNHRWPIRYMLMVSKYEWSQLTSHDFSKYGYPAV